VQGYNAQLAVDSETQVIVAAEVTQQVLDRGQLLTMMESTEQNTGQQPEVVTADAGYWDTEAVQQAIHSGAQVLVPPDGAANPESPPGAADDQQFGGAAHACRASYRGWTRALSNAASHR